jgi:hypothetical protein
VSQISLLVLAREQVTADFAEGVGDPPWRCAEGRPKLTESAREFRKAFPCARPGRVTPGGAEAGAVQAPSFKTSLRDAILAWFGDLL